jgi:hypothetical protein
MVGVLGVRSIDCRTGVPPPVVVQVTVSVVVPAMPPSCAEIVVEPHPVAVARPAALTVATLGVLDDQVAVEVRSSGAAFESLVVPVAINCVVCPICATVAAWGVTAMETRCLLLQPPTTSRVESPR